MLSRVTSVAVSVLAPIACAQMMGETITAEWHYGGLGAPIEAHQIVVGNGVELTADDILNDTKFSIDLTGNTVSFAFNAASFWSVNNFNGWYFADTNDTLPDIIGYQIGSFSGTGTPVVTTGWDDNAFWANFQGSQFYAGDVITMEVIFVPAPSAAMAGLIGLAALRRRR
ncbi:MAG: hypothetical protein DYG94_06885 [Leptolyngbya sp. PLA3]|nr:MAG: hypothetical protein EDM82_06230 [Cyanobacteria bacterium CYA]MCE7968453.1 hypothetical protein [Leptolyngbya sp. PL-A3]